MRGGGVRLCLQVAPPRLHAAPRRPAPRSAALLDDVRELVREQRVTRNRAGAVLAAVERDVAPDRERAGVQVARETSRTGRRRGRAHLRNPSRTRAPCERASPLEPRPGPSLDATRRGWRLASRAPAVLVLHRALRAARVRGWGSGLGCVGVVGLLLALGPRGHRRPHPLDGDGDGPGGGGRACRRRRRVAVERLLDVRRVLARVVAEPVVDVGASRRLPTVPCQLALDSGLHPGAELAQEGALRHLAGLEVGLPVLHEEAGRGARGVRGVGRGGGRRRGVGGGGAAGAAGAAGAPGLSGSGLRWMPSGACDKRLSKRLGLPVV